MIYCHGFSCPFLQFILFMLLSVGDSAQEIAVLTSPASIALNKTDVVNTSAVLLRHHDVINVTGVTLRQRDVLSCEIESEAELESCLKSGRLFLKKYLHRMGQDSGQCRVYEKFRSCFKRLHKRCASVPVNHLSWIGVLEQMDCICNHSTACLKGQTCFFDEFHGFWSEKCDDLYRFNLAQKTRDSCYFLEDNIECKLALVRTACDDVTTRFAVSVLRINSEKEQREHNCSATNHDRHPFPVSFSYTKNCTRKFLQRIDVCIKPLTHKNVIKFHIDYDLVPAETVSSRALVRACRAWRKYKRCLQPLEASCKEGVNQVLSHHHDLRKYFMKMDSICDNTNNEEFRQHLRCYQKVVKKNLLGQCNALWTQVQPWQRNTTAYQFYCEKSHPNTLNLVRELQRVGDCHKNVFAEKCGTNASILMSKLFRKAFNDPSYLRLGYVPDCALLAPPTTTTTSTTITSTTTTQTTETVSSPFTPVIAVGLKDRTIALSSPDNYHIFENTPAIRLATADNIRLLLQQSEANMSIARGPMLTTLPFWTSLALLYFYFVT